MFLPEAFSTEPTAGSTTKTVDCWMGPRNLSWYLPCRLKELGGGAKRGRFSFQHHDPKRLKKSSNLLGAPAAVPSVENHQVGLSVQGQS